MARNIQERFGVTIEINRDIPKDKYVALQSQLRDAVGKAGFSTDKVRVYIHHISVRASDLHFQVGPLSKRMEELTVYLNIGEKARINNMIRFLNHKIQVAYQSDVKVKSKDFRMEYSLSGHYCQTHREFDDYVALLVEPNCPEKLKKISMKLTAYATPDFAKKLINNPSGATVTKLEFPLSQDIQLTF